MVGRLLRPDHAHQQIVQRRELAFPKSRRVVAEVLEDVHGRPVDERRAVEHHQPGNVGLYAVDDVAIRAVVARRKRILVIVGPGDARYVNHIEGLEIAAPDVFRGKPIRQALVLLTLDHDSLAAPAVKPFLNQRPAVLAVEVKGFVGAAQIRGQCRINARDLERQAQGVVHGDVDNLPGLPARHVPARVLLPAVQKIVAVIGVAGALRGVLQGPAVPVPGCPAAVQHHVADRLTPGDDPAAGTDGKTAHA